MNRYSFISSGLVRFHSLVVWRSLLNRGCHSVVDGSVDVAVIGGGIVGTATALTLKKAHPHLNIALIEKENRLAAHQSGNNSGVVHAGIYYKPGSLKATLCVRGMRLAYQYFDQHNIPYKKVGKLIVAVDQSEVAGLKNLFDRGRQNNVPDLQMLTPEQFRDIEPCCQGVAALWSPMTGIVDWAEVTRRFSADFCDRGGRLLLNSHVIGVDEHPDSSSSSDLPYPVTVILKNQPAVKCRYLICCSGLYSDRLAALSGCSSEPQIVPFRGEYLLLREEKRYLVRGNIYPVPDPRFPFLGVHFTPRMDGAIWLGPNAVWALAREGYSWSHVSSQDILQCLKYPGFRIIASRYLKFGVGEFVRSILPQLQVQQLRRYIPQISASDVIRGPAGVRAQALSISGDLVEDFIVESGALPKHSTSSCTTSPASCVTSGDSSRVVAGRGSSRVLHVRNAPSPAATSSLAIAELIVKSAEQDFSLTLPD